jgi:hypothetical protein
MEAPSLFTVGTELAASFFMELESPLPVQSFQSRIIITRIRGFAAETAADPDRRRKVMHEKRCERTPLA